MDLVAPPQLRTLLLCDLVDSTALVERMGDRQAADLLRRHDRIARDLMQVHHGQEIDKTDGFLVLFERPVHAVGFALEYQRALKALGREQRTPLRTRVGIHTGEIMSWENNPDDIAHGAKRLEIEGLVKPVAARLMNLALPDQILLSSITYSLALRAQAELTAFGDSLRWKAHGDYRFKGVPEPMAVVEVGEKGIAPLHPPPSSFKARRELPWWRRPAALAAQVGLLLLVAGVVLYMQFVSPPAIAFAERDWVVVSDVRNLTGQNILDDSLDAAFRIGLEQSRFVNVLPDLQVRDALQRMERDPATRVDRGVAAEIAQREGARAVVAPSISEVGGRVRFTIEVIEPRSGRTAYSESADGRGLQSAMGSMDSVLKRMRARLGESLDRIESDSEPLEQVTSGNLEALKAFSLAIRAASRGDGRQAIALFQRAIELDPGFAAAHSKLAGYFLQSGNGARAHHHLVSAAAQRDRLTSRDRLYVDAHLAFFETPDRMIDRWSQLASLFPDFLTGQQNLAMVLWMYEHRFEEADALFREVAESRHPFRGLSMENRAFMLLAAGKAGEAKALAEDSRDTGMADIYFGRIVVATAERDYTTAEELARTGDARGFAYAEVELRMRRLVLDADRGRIADALEAAGELRQIAERAEFPAAEARAGLQELVLRVGRTGSAPAEMLSRFVDLELERLDSREGRLDGSPVTHLLLASLLASRSGALQVAEAALEGARGHAENSGFHDRESLLIIARAELARARGDAEAAAAALSGLLRDERAPYQARVAALLAAADLDRRDEVRTHAAWLRQHRGLAFAEYLQQFAAQALNVLDSNMAVLTEAELAWAMGDAAAARTLALPVQEAWSDADPDFAPAARLRALLAQLSVEEKEGQASGAD